MHPSAKLVINPQSRVNQLTFTDVFLNAPSGDSEDFVPLTPFMIHVWRQHGLTGEAILERNKDRERFVYSFYDTFHKSLAPHLLVAPPKTLRWLNRPALDISSDFESHT